MANNPLTETPLSDLPDDGERFIPSRMFGEIKNEHFHRYILAQSLVEGKRVLDIASGDGYGSAILAEKALYVHGIDISEDAVSSANKLYKKDNLEYTQGDCRAIPIETHSIDVVVSFETIEHHDSHEEMLDEFKRVLKPNGLLILSSPDKLEYSDKQNYKNPFHVKELYFDELDSLIKRYFLNSKHHGQRLLFGSYISSDESREKIKILPIDVRQPSSTFWLTLASDGPIPTITDSVYESSFIEFKSQVATCLKIEFNSIIKRGFSNKSRILEDSLRSKWYRENNEDLFLGGVDPVKHWWETGWSEGRAPSENIVELIIDMLTEQRLTSIFLNATSADTAQYMGTGGSAEEIHRLKLRHRYEIESVHEKYNDDFYKQIPPQLSELKELLRASASCISGQESFTHEIMGEILEAKTCLSDYTANQYKLTRKLLDTAENIHKEIPCLQEFIAKQFSEHLVSAQHKADEKIDSSQHDLALKLKSLEESLLHALCCAGESHRQTILKMELNHRSQISEILNQNRISSDQQTQILLAGWAEQRSLLAQQIDALKSKLEYLSAQNKELTSRMNTDRADWQARISDDIHRVQLVLREKIESLSTRPPPKSKSLITAICTPKKNLALFYSDVNSNWAAELREFTKSLPALLNRNSSAGEDFIDQRRNQSQDKN